jgi:hypothetical protein
MNDMQTDQPFDFSGPAQDDAQPAQAPAGEAPISPFDEDIPDPPEAPDEAPSEPAPEARRLFSRAVALVLNCSQLGTVRKRPTSSVDTLGADARRVKVSASIMESKTIDAIGSWLNETRREIAARSTPSVMFKSGVYLLGINLINESDEYLIKRRDGLADLVRKLENEYETIKADAQRELGPGMFRATDYPPIETLAGKIGISWAYISVDAPATLAEVSKTIMRREQEKAAATWRDALEEASAVLRAGFRELIGHMVEKLEPGDDGKRRIFRDSLVGNVREFLRTFPDRNLGDDAELAALAAEAGNILAGVDAASLRDDDSLRESVARGMATIKAKLDEAITDAPQRRYSRS